MRKQYIYLGDSPLDFKDFRFVKGVVYYESEKINKKLEEYPLLRKILLDINELSKINRESQIFSIVTKQLKEQIEGGND